MLDGIARAKADERRRELLFGRDLDAGVRRVAQLAGRESRGEARLIRQDLVLALVALPRQRHRLRLGHEARRRLHGRDDRRAMRLVVARLISQRQVAVEVVLDAAGVALLLDLVEVVADAAVEILVNRPAASR